MKRRLITSALPYVNNVPHLGNLIQVLSADAFARFCRLSGCDTLYVCGTDEYGTATETRAAEEGVEPRELCDRYHAIHAAIYRWFNIAFDIFGRTSTPIQTEIVQDIFKKLDANGYIVERSIEQLHCETCGRFLADRYVRGVCPHCGYEGARGDQCESCGKLLDPTELKDPRCSTCGTTPVAQKTNHLYIDLPKIKGLLEGWIHGASEKGFWANNAVAMTHAWIRDGLKERAITRDLKWGIPVPKAGYENKVFYVWFDAPIGYISITGNLAVERGLDWRAFVDDWWKNPDNVELFQFIGKDNIPFHTVIFPSSLLGSGDPWTMLHHMSSTEYLNYETGKFSKSEGRGVFGTDAMETGVPADVWRFYIFYNRPERSDSTFTWRDFQEKVNGELIGNLGNLVNRILMFVTRYYDGKIPDGVENVEFWNTVRSYETDIAEKLERADLRDAFHTIFELSAYANKVFQEGEPWKKRVTDPVAAANLIRDLCFVVRDIAALIEPYMPHTAEKLASFFGLTMKGAEFSGETSLSWEHVGKLSGIHRVATPEALFSKLEDDAVKRLSQTYSGTQKERQTMENAVNGVQQEGKPAKKHQVESEIAKGAVKRAFAELDLRVAEIVKIERHPKADKLYIETLDIAGEERIIVSGLVPFYKEEELLNKRIIIAYNLKPAKLRGVESRGMLLAASVKDAEGGEIVEVLDAGDAPVGTRIALEGSVPPAAPPAEITIDDFLAAPIAVQDRVVMAEGKKLCAARNPIVTKVVINGAVR
ncbi:MAG: methionine--tRNA ligase [Treponema sp.]|jgi:methionyl-tRNA synthetase|nr:methionine--tRNA ligase [Treponema sp.]